MITSTRKFGIEIEFSAKNHRLLDSISSRINVVADGSLRDAGVLGGEYVSSILNGKTGEEEIRRVCEILKKYDAHGEHPATSVHVHLDGKTNVEVTKSKSRDKEYNGNIIAVSNRLSKLISENELAYIISKNRLPMDSRQTIYANTIDNVTYYSCADISRHPMTNYSYYYKGNPNRFEWLRNVLYFYTQYSEVMENIVSPSRRYGNMYCIPLDKSYNLPDIEATKTIDELRNLWYKGNEVRTHYDDSRYHNVNLHCFWFQNGTVEIRSHGGTIDANKILLWVKMHQKIVDKLENLSLKDIKVSGNLYENFFDFLEEPILQEYYRRLLGYYSGIKVNK